MPKLTVFPLEGHSFYHLILLVQKSEFCTEAEITHTEETYFLQDVLSCQLND